MFWGCLSICVCIIHLSACSGRGILLPDLLLTSSFDKLRDAIDGSVIFLEYISQVGKMRLTTVVAVDDSDDAVTRMGIVLSLLL